MIGVSQQSVGNWLRQATDAVLDVEADQETREAHPEWIQELSEHFQLILQHSDLRGRGKHSGMFQESVVFKGAGRRRPRRSNTRVSPRPHGIGNADQIRAAADPTASDAAIEFILQLVQNRSRSQE